MAPLDNEGRGGTSPVDGKPSPRPDHFRDIDSFDILQHMGAAVIITDEAYRIMHFNPAAETLYGWSQGEVLGQPVHEMLPVPEEGAVTDDIIRHLKGHEGFEGELRTRRRDGSSFTARVSIRPVLDAEGRLKHIVGVAEDVSDVHDLHAQTRRQRDRFNDLLEGLSEGFFALDADLTVTFFNRKAEALLGRDRSEILDRPLFDAFPEARGSIFEEEYRAAIRSRKPSSFEVHFGVEPYRNWYDVRTYPFEDGIAVYFNVTTERKEREQELVAREELYRQIFESAQVGLYRTRIEDGKLLLANTTMARLFGYDTPEEAIAEYVTSEHYVDDGTRERLVALLRKNGHIDNYEARLTRCDGSILWIRYSGVLHEEEGFIEGVAVDVTREKEAFDALQTSERIYRDTFESAPIGMFHADPEGYLEMVNPAVARMFGFESPELMIEQVNERGGTQALYQEDDQRDQVFARILDGGPGEWPSFEAHYRRRDGSRMIGSLTARMVRREDGEPLYVEGFLEDVTEIRRAEQELKGSLRRARELEVVINRSPAVAFIWEGDEVWTVSYVSENITRFGYSREDFMSGRIRYRDIVFEEDLNRVTEEVNGYAASSDQGFAQSYRIVDGNGGVRWVDDRTWVVRDSMGNVLHFQGLIMDVTDRKREEEERRRLEEKVQQAQKMESLGILAGGIAHDFNNMLVGILGNADLAMMETSQASPAWEFIHDIATTASRASELSRQMLAYSGRGKFVVERVDMQAVIEEMVHMIEVSISKKAVLKFDFADHLAGVEGDVTQLRQIIMNLVINASEAIGERSGVIHISTGMLECDRDYLAETYLDEDLPEGVYVYVEVSDTGCGMDAETKAKIFDPFFTTKFTGRGLGLAAVLGIVRSHHGAIKVYSEAGRGTTFKILLPASENAEPVAPVDAPGVQWRGKGTVLLVDDEDTVLVVGKRMLQKLGFDVVTAEHGREALEQASDLGPELSAVVLDLTMPHMDGEETFRELRRMGSGAPVILTSGYNEQEVVDRFSGKGLAGFLQKPYKWHQLRDVLRAAIERS